MTTQAWIALTRPGRDSRAGTPAGRSWLLLGLVLAGLFAMHGLGTHGTHSPHRTDPLSGTSMSSAAPAGVSHEGHDLGLGHEMAVVGADALEAVVAPAGGGRAGGLLLGLCFAVLAATFGLLLTLIARGGLTPLRLPVSAPVGPRTPRGRDPDPPDLARLSVRRC